MLPQSARLLALACLSLFVSCISAGVFRSYTARVGLQKVKLMPHQEIMNKRTLWLRFGPWDMISHNPLTGFATFAYQNANQHHLEMTGVWLEEHGMLRFAAPGEEWTNNGTFYGEDAQGIKISGKWIGQAHWDVNLPKPEWLRTHTSEQMSQADKDNMRDRYWKSDKGGDQSTKTEMANGSNQNTRASGSNLPITGTLTSRWPHDPVSLVRGAISRKLFPIAQSKWKATTGRRDVPESNWVTCSRQTSRAVLDP